MRIGVLGGGQLGRMLALAGLPLGHRFRFLDPKPDPPVRDLGEVVRTDYDDPAALDRFVQGLDVVTYEFENVPVEAARRLEGRAPVLPPPPALEMAQDRLVEKEGFRGLGIPTAPWRPVDGPDDLDRALAELGTPAVLKSRRFGYDGKGQVIVVEPSGAGDAWAALEDRAPLILEGFVAFDRELSVLAVRSRRGQVAFYPLVENHHRDGILYRSLAPAPEVDDALQALAESHARKVLEELGYVGVLAVELFQCGDELLANEMAPRVHNSGHWTQDGAECSQFENHVRAVCGEPLGTTAPVGHSAMVNLLGSVPDRSEVLAVPGAHLHLYDKAPRPLRKLGHVNVRAGDREVVAETLRRVEALLDPPPE